MSATVHRIPSIMKKVQTHELSKKVTYSVYSFGDYVYTTCAEYAGGAYVYYV